METLFKITIVIVLMIAINKTVFASSKPEKGIYLYNCNIDYRVLRWIAMAERHYKRDVGYPYLISFNKISSKIKTLLKNEKCKKLDNRTIDCLNESNCQQITKKLIKNGYKNLDLGAFQINYYYHPDNLNIFFNLKKSYIKACSILEPIIEEHGYSWESIAMYHSFTPKHKIKYLRHISQIISAENKQENKEFK